MLSRPYLDLLRQAQRAARRADEAEDLLQAILLSAVEAGRADLSCPDNRRWLAGALRKRAAFDARSAMRRRVREQRWAARVHSADEKDELPVAFLASLPPSLRTTALLALTGHTRQEIAWLLGLADTALRQRIADVRRRWRAAGHDTLDDMPGLTGGLAFGRIRQALLKPVRQQGAVLASHDPDGHLFVVSLSSQNAAARQPGKRTTPTTG